MRYLLLIYGNAELQAQMSPEEGQADFAEYMEFNKIVREKGVHEIGEALHPTNMATSVRLRDGKLMVTDGPFAETKEQLGGFYLLNVASLDEAIELAAKIPGVKRGTIEIRPIWEAAASAS